ncbi:hypothetical protein EUGRSUZ_B03512 [Eucalyptus grandis]|uniref:Uncharacterized protein n=2 Tax=Eucalyptus grandis TaxID=71139 RepID=A0ACC3LXX6_EUCGR|nr:hypothetical protein EUGRSUZ_B03512 [Eucalyptus grandis]
MQEKLNIGLKKCYRKIGKSCYSRPNEIATSEYSCHNLGVAQKVQPLSYKLQSKFDYSKVNNLFWRQSCSKADVTCSFYKQDCSTFSKPKMIYLFKSLHEGSYANKKSTHIL